MTGPGTAAVWPDTPETSASPPVIAAFGERAAKSNVSARTENQLAIMRQEFASVSPAGGAIIVISRAFRDISGRTARGRANAAQVNHVTTFPDNACALPDGPDMGASRCAHKAASVETAQKFAPVNTKTCYAHQLTADAPALPDSLVPNVTKNVPRDCGDVTVKKNAFVPGVMRSPVSAKSVPQGGLDPIVSRDAHPTGGETIASKFVRSLPTKESVKYFTLTTNSRISFKPALII